MWPFRLDRRRQCWLASQLLLFTPGLERLGDSPWAGGMPAPGRASECADSPRRGRRSLSSSVFAIEGAEVDGD